MSRAGNLADFLPMQQKSLLAAAIGRRLEDVERLLVTTHRDFVDRGGASDEYFASASGPTELIFSGGLVHALSTWPSQLSVLVESERFDPDPYATRHRLSTAVGEAPSWLLHVLGTTVTDVRWHELYDDVPSDEARQAAVSYVLSTGVEFFYGIYLHGRMSGDELVRREDLPLELPARSLSLRPEGRERT